MNLPGLKAFGDLALGAAFRAREGTTEAVEKIRTVEPPENGLLGKAGELRAQAGELRGRAQERVVELAAQLEELRRRGETERQRGQSQLAEAMDAAVTRMATSALVNRIVDFQVDRILGTLAKEPDRIQGLVRGQRDTVVGEMVGRVRSGAAAGDAAVDRLTLRMSRRDGAAETP
ncbi:hypothetical protein ACTI_39610 [Actinoplanes sp. OR16]|uniref:hypothetical protein n=1 Tax=Actinoplanes sp. OR16 TaxID=946334 RepID=UPI000F70C118|nr:hypothetical protein [Actinoplanes sp. OR16]BBH67276.1 hypothetical protein ACTI_39610 [Actinoplanes sp. OR16]